MQVFCPLVVTGIAALLTITSARSYPLEDPRFLVRFFQITVMLGGFLGVVSGSMIPPAGSDLRMSEVELAAPLSYAKIFISRVVGNIVMIIVWPAAVGVLVAVWQVAQGTGDLIGSLGALILIEALGTISSLLLGFFVGSFFAKGIGVIASVVLWSYMVFMPPTLGLPTLNATIFSVIGDQFCSAVFNATPIYQGRYPEGLAYIPIAAVLTTGLAYVLMFIIGLAHLKGRALR